ncbi:MAG: Wzz/FepE/Etk N-terminal domain-containing protein [Coriobacteriia bacterium]
MTPHRVATALTGAVKRQWWIVALAIVAGLVAGYVLAMDQQTTYTARATLRVDSSTLARVSGLPGPERLLKAIGTDAFRDGLSSETDVPAADMKSSLTAFTVGSPAENFVLEYTSIDAGEAEKVAAAAAPAVRDEVRERGATELDRQAATIAETEAFLGVLAAVQVETEWERADIAFRTWQARRELTDAVALQSTYERAYVLEGDTSVATSSASAKRLNDAAGAAVVAAAAGLGLALVRERLFLRGARG